jgi:maltooligosyltrehalose synthase
VSDNVGRGEQAADEVARRWIATMQSMGDQLVRQQQTLKQMTQEQMTQEQMTQEQMSSYVQLLNTPPFYVSQQPQQEGQKATGQAFQQASEQWMELARKQQQTYQQMSQQWMEQAQAQQQAFQQIVQKSLGAYTDLFKPPSA